MQNCFQNEEILRWGAHGLTYNSWRKNSLFFELFTLFWRLDRREYFHQVEDGGCKLRLGFSQLCESTNLFNNLMISRGIYFIYNFFPYGLNHSYGWFVAESFKDHVSGRWSVRSRTPNPTQSYLISSYLLISSLLIFLSHLIISILSILIIVEYTRLHYYIIHSLLIRTSVARTWGHSIWWREWIKLHG